MNKLFLNYICFKKHMILKKLNGYFKNLYTLLIITQMIFEIDDE